MLCFLFYFLPFAHHHLSTTLSLNAIFLLSTSHQSVFCCWWCWIEKNKRKRNRERSLLFLSFLFSRRHTHKFTLIWLFVWGVRVVKLYHLDSFAINGRLHLKVSGGDEQTLQQTYLPREVQVAFKVLMTHCVLQFAWRIAFRCVLHRYGSQDIRCWKCWTFYL